VGGGVGGGGGGGGEEQVPDISRGGNLLLGMQQSREGGYSNA